MKRKDEEEKNRNSSHLQKKSSFLSEAAEKVGKMPISCLFEQ